MGYLHVGQNLMLEDKRIIGIFDLDITSQSKITRTFLNQAEEEGIVISAIEDIPKSFVVCDHPYHEQIIYLSQLNPSTLKHRAESQNLEL